MNEEGLDVVGREWVMLLDAMAWIEMCD